MSKLQRSRFKQGWIYLYPPLRLSFSMCGLWTTYAQNPRSTPDHSQSLWENGPEMCIFSKLPTWFSCISNFKSSILIHLSLDTRCHTPAHPVDPSLYYFIAFYRKAFFSSVTFLGSVLSTLSHGCLVCSCIPPFRISFPFSSLI